MLDCYLYTIICITLSIRYFWCFFVSIKEDDMIIAVSVFKIFHEFYCQKYEKYLTSTRYNSYVCMFTTYCIVFSFSMSPLPKLLSSEKWVRSGDPARARTPDFASEHFSQAFSSVAKK